MQFVENLASSSSFLSVTSKNIFRDEMKKQKKLCLTEAILGTDGTSLVAHFHFHSCQSKERHGLEQNKAE